MITNPNVKYPLCRPGYNLTTKQREIIELLRNERIEEAREFILDILEKEDSKGEEIMGATSIDPDG